MSVLVGTKPIDEANISLLHQPMYAFAVRMAVDLKLFELIDTAKPCIDAADLSSASGASQDLISTHPHQDYYHDWG